MKIRVLSDLHLESDQPEIIPHADADLVVLAGDIHNHAEGLRWAAETFDGAVPVVYVPGNHEYYDGEFGALEAAMHDAAASVDNVYFLNNATLVDPLGQWRVLGTTLWTDFDLYGNDEDSRAASIAAAERVMLDYRGLIQVTWTAGNDSSGQGALQDNTPRNLTPADTIALHRHARAWLEAELAKPFAGKTIVVTHHAPHRRSLAERYADDVVSAGFVNDLPSLVRAPVTLWVHGHTHTAFDYVENGARVVCNPRGYLDRRTRALENAAFAWNKVVEI
ncbi:MULTISPECIES: metallophosphoesterase [Paraburkholderia]|jgi:3',5'-cyclic AMP phosphodiesterase CpdA|uniref:Metallophosphoesterase n=1 Tax=Paraburkholderia hospita TaxID=169430 RepID=A0AAJ4SWB7_9BURK|nr:metallophosphoesterase [Paraburkholderia hospita]SOE53640.1 Calcineurin-like phosphoesterase [Burkholderia sp. YR290]AUT67800.1 metallophosphoesterase [Paraburkholderia hospita]AXE97937.1 metallophosphoesterase [Paraburkholderia hospita]SEH87895.1 Calcineurin-like phosphoesterase [Paraburkholderia hospita]SKC76469.1 Calcineurin-like phosphoesterase [Paraburkholderia hospita]